MFHFIFRPVGIRCIEWLVVRIVYSSITTVDLGKVQMGGFFPLKSSTYSFDTSIPGGGGLFIIAVS